MKIKEQKQFIFEFRTYTFTMIAETVEQAKYKLQKDLENIIKELEKAL